MSGSWSQYLSGLFQQKSWGFLVTVPEKGDLVLTPAGGLSSALTSWVILQRCQEELRPVPVFLRCFFPGRDGSCARLILCARAPPLFGRGGHLPLLPCCWPVNGAFSVVSMGDFWFIFCSVRARIHGRVLLCASGPGGDRACFSLLVRDGSVSSFC